VPDPDDGSSRPRGRWSHTTPAVAARPPRPLPTRPGRPAGQHRPRTRAPTGSCRSRPPPPRSSAGSFRTDSDRAAARGPAAPSPDRRSPAPPSCHSTTIGRTCRRWMASCRPGVRPHNRRMRTMSAKDERGRRPARPSARRVRRRVLPGPDPVGHPRSGRSRTRAGVRRLALGSSRGVPRHDGRPASKDRAGDRRHRRGSRSGTTDRPHDPGDRAGRALDRRRATPHRCRRQPRRLPAPAVAGWRPARRWTLALPTGRRETPPDAGRPGHGRRGGRPPSGRVLRARPGRHGPRRPARQHHQARPPAPRARLAHPRRLRVRGPRHTVGRGAQPRGTARLVPARPTDVAAPQPSR
jgi:hypothetical protein